MEQLRARSMVAVELARALGGGLLLPLRAAHYLATHARQRAELTELIASDPPPIEEPPRPILPARPLTIFISCAEASGEIHACSLVRALRREIAASGAPPARFLGLGGTRLAEEGVELIGRPVDHARMGLSGVAGELPYYLGLLTDAARAFERERPDVFAPVDSPALHVPLARLARSSHVQVVHFVTPQYWGWAPWRARGYRRAVDSALAILPFERAWFARRGIACTHVGHPLLDLLVDVPATIPADDARELVLLCGSRASVIARNLPWMLGVALPLVERTPGLELTLAHEDLSLRPTLEALVRAAGASGRVRIDCGDLHASLARARAAFSVSGTVLIDLLHHHLPAVVVYRLASAREAWLGRHFLTAPYFSSVNLLAGRELYPEFAFHGDGPRAEVGLALERCYNDPHWRRATIAALEQARLRLGPPGAATRAARAVLALAARTG